MTIAETAAIAAIFPCIRGSLATSDDDVRRLLGDGSARHRRAVTGQRSSAPADYRQAMIGDLVQTQVGRWITAPPSQATAAAQPVGVCVFGVD
jgi:hypothetical protein